MAWILTCKEFSISIEKHWYLQDRRVHIMPMPTKNGFWVYPTSHPWLVPDSMVTHPVIFKYCEDFFWILHLFTRCAPNVHHGDFFPPHLQFIYLFSLNLLYIPGNYFLFFGKWVLLVHLQANNNYILFWLNLLSASFVLNSVQMFLPSPAAGWTYL